MPKEFKEEDFDAVWNHYKSYFIDVLNGDYDLSEARSDLESLIGSKWDPRGQTKFDESELLEDSQ